MDKQTTFIWIKHIQFTIVGENEAAHQDSLLMFLMGDTHLNSRIANYTAQNPTNAALRLRLYTPGRQRNCPLRKMPWPA